MLINKYKSFIEQSRNVYLKSRHFMGNIIYHNKLQQFIFEKENNNSLTFLDLKIKDQKIIAKIIVQIQILVP